ncbi:MAG: hypothetical protein HY957_11570 [Nitrospirae bacterium]|nr:hypothetical protein [Nitrospirota bacterium]
MSRSVSKIIQPRGEVKSISVAVLVDGTYKKEKGKTTYAPRSEEDIKKYRELLMGAIGYNKERGDQIIIENVPFETGVEELPPAKIDFLKIGMSIVKYLIPLAVVVLLILFVIKPIVEALKAPVIRKMPEGVIPARGAPTVAAEPEEIIQEDVLEMVKKDPRRASMILKEWLAE